MISDHERRDIAEGLRGLKGECVPLSYVLDELGVDCDGADVPKAHVKRLADLIDRPVTRNLSEKPEFMCELCDSVWPYDLGFTHCPECGAEVVD